MNISPHKCWSFYLEYVFFCRNLATAACKSASRGRQLLSRNGALHAHQSSAQARQESKTRGYSFFSSSLKRASIAASSSLVAEMSALRAPASSVGLAKEDRPKGNRHPPPPKHRPRPPPLNELLQESPRVPVLCPHCPRPQPVRGPPPAGPVLSNPGMLTPLSETGPVPVPFLFQFGATDLFSCTCRGRASCSRDPTTFRALKLPKPPKSLLLSTG